MITLPIALEKFMQGKDLTGLKPFALLYRNKWNSVTEKYELDTTPIDISAHITKPNTLSMTLDVNEVAQYNANNVTLSLSDTKNQFVEGTPESYFPAGYQIYGSKVVLYYGITSPINPYPTQVGYTVVGSPTITDGVMSDISNANYAYATTDSTMYQSIVSFETAIKFTTGTSAPTGSLFGWQNGHGGAYINNSHRIRCVAIDFSAKKYRDYLTSFSALQANKTYYFKYEFRNNHGYCSLKEEGGEWQTEEIETGINNYNQPSNYNYFYGRNNQASGYLTGGASIDFNNTYIKVNGEYWFNGAHFFYEPQATPLFTGVIKEPPTHKPEKYQVDVKLVSPLEMLKDIEAKDFSDKITGEALTYQGTDDDGHRIYWTSGTGVGGFDAVYANGVKLFEGVDYETDQLNAFGLPAIVTIINSDYYSSTITADYYTWKTNLTVEQIVAGLVNTSNYIDENTDIRNVVWNTEVQGRANATIDFTIGYKQGNNPNSYNYTGSAPFWTSLYPQGTTAVRYNKFPNNFQINFNLYPPWWIERDNYYYQLGQFNSSNNLVNGFSLAITASGSNLYLTFSKVSNGDYSVIGSFYRVSRDYNEPVVIKKQGNSITFTTPGGSVTTAINFDINDTNVNEKIQNRLDRYIIPIVTDYKLTDLSTGAILSSDGVMSTPLNIGTDPITWKAILATFTNISAQHSVRYRTSDDLISYSDWGIVDVNVSLGVNAKYIQFSIDITTPDTNTNIEDIQVSYLGASGIVLQLVNLSGRTVLEALQDFALISGYEFGVDRQGVFFFRPRISSTTPIFELDHSQLEKVDTVKKNLSDFFTKLTLTFAQVPLEFYANTGERPTLVDKYGIINKEIDKPDIVNYDNPELAQAIGPQLLEVYSALPNIIQAVGKLNLALELGDIVNLKRNLNLIADPEGSDFDKYRRQQTYYRACKITGMNYNFAKRQITYTLRDVSNTNNMPQIYAYGFPYDLPIQLGKLKTE